VVLEVPEPEEDEPDAQAVAVGAAPRDELEQMGLF
jgi:hypothetical protein